MKIKIVFTSAILAAVMFACNSEKKADVVAVDSLGTEATYTADTAASLIRWEGNMGGKFVYKHFGTLKISEGTFTAKGLQITGGSFTANLKSINPTDSNYTEKTPRVGLIGHLGGADFFAVDSFPTATFVIKSVNGNSATGDLTLRGKTNSETVTDIVVDTTAGVKATGKLVFNRQKYGVAYKAAKDLLLSDDITLDIALVGKK
ncbi:YceI family protein [Cytophaga aurantiaca]|uniref:YceI family protein n=1 Tax=Cytophaga aurantiaca TaxID=29530 RepID=UPI00039DE0F5|nr:YceI family protein [Cytophaga aurantiaca]